MKDEVEKFDIHKAYEELNDYVDELERDFDCVKRLLGKEIHEHSKLKLQVKERCRYAYKQRKAMNKLYEFARSEKCARLSKQAKEELLVLIGELY